MKKILFCLLSGLSVCGWSQNTIGLPQVVNFSNNSFRGGAQTWDIKQDEEGRMYFANNEGLLTYDGNYWKLYPQPNKTIMRSLALYKNKIFAGGQDEIGFYAPDKQGVLAYTSLKTLIPKQYSSFTDVWDIEVFGQSVFFLTYDRIFEYKNDAIRIYPAKVGWTMLKMNNNRLVALDRKKGFFQFTNDVWQPLGSESIPPPFDISDMVPLGNDTILVSSIQYGLHIFYKGTFSKTLIKTSKDFDGKNIYCLKQISDSEFVAGTISSGCVVINKDGNIIQQIARPEGLQNNNVLSVFLDKDKNLWTGLDNGISFIAYNSAVKYIKPGKPDELSGYSVRVYNNELYIATSDGAYVAPLLQNAKDLSFSKGDFFKLKNSGGQAWRFDEINHQLLMGHHHGSFLIGQNNEMRLIDSTGTWLYLPTSSVYPSAKVLVGNYNGLSLLDYTNKKLSNIGQINGVRESLRFLAIDNENVVWASHPYRGVYRVTLSPDTLSFKYELFTEQDGLPSTLRNNVFRIKNRVVFATERGVYEFDSEKRKFIPSPLLYNVFGDIKIQYLNEDTDGNIWFCSGKKIGVVTFDAPKNIYKTTYFPELTGAILSGFEFVYPYNKENIFIASTNGIIHLNFKKYFEGSTGPHMLLTQVKTSGNLDSVIFGGYYVRGKDSSVAKPGDAILQLPHSSNSFHFEFSSPGIQSNINYSYQLNGYDQSWSVPSSKTEKEYTNLPDGSYTFMVKAFDNLGHESQPVTYRFVINPPIYKTIWAFIFYLLAAATGIYLLIKWQKRKFTRQQLQFEEEQKQLKYIYELEREKNEKEIVQLQNEKLINEVIYKNKELADISMHLMERSDALVKVKDELQRLYKKTAGNHDLQQAIVLVNEIEKNDSNWEQFATHFDEINNDFIKKLKIKFPHLTSTDLKVCTYLQLKLSSKEIAQLMNISLRGVEISRYRLRKKLQLSTGQTLNDFLNDIL